MLVLPENVIEPASLQPFSEVPEDGTEPLVGPVKNFVVPLMLSQDDGGLERSEEMVGVQVIDMSLPGALNILSAYPEDGEDMDLVSNFSHLDINARPSFGDLLPMVVAWIGEETEERLAFYTADEGPQSSASPKAKAKAPHTLPDGSTAPGKAKSAAKKPTVATLSQQMETVLAALPMITDQLSALTMKQDMLERQQRSAPSDQPGFRPIAAGKSAQPISSLLRGTPKNLSTLAADLGPPPKTRATGGLTVPLLPEQVMEEDEPVDPMQSEVAEGLGSPMAQLLVEQGRVLAALVSQMQAGSTDPMSDLSSTTPTMGVKGTLAREKMQRELAAGTGAFFLKVCQAIQRRVNPASRLATNLSEVGDVSLLGYLERYGGFGQNRELGMVQWSLGHVFDAMAKEEWNLARDHLALSAVMVEQAALDSNRWNLAWLLRLLDDPPQNLWLSRGQSATGGRRPFAPLCVPSWTTAALAYMKESEVLQSKKGELVGAPSRAAGSEDAAPNPKAPKRRPGRGKGNQASQSSQDQEKA